MSRLPQYLLLALAAVYPLMSSANAVSSEFAAGGLEFRHSSSIAMTSQELYLSPKLVRVSYVFHSSAAATQHLLLAFPVPARPVGAAVDQVAFDGDGAPPRFTRQPQDEAFNYMDFSVRVNGSAMIPSGRGRALLEGHDVTARLLRDGVPLVFGGNSFRQLDTLPATVRERLRGDGLLDSDFSPLWDYHAAFTWEQDFAAGDTRVEISYQPSLGDMVDIDWNRFPDDATKRTYCFDEPLRHAASARANSLELYTLGYILTTANGWAGPIGHFRLIVDKGAAGNLVALCPADVHKISLTQFEWSAKDFVPTHDLRVLFLINAS